MHKYGVNLGEDLKNLFKTDIEAKELLRKSLFGSVISSGENTVRTISSIIQNPVPITKEQLNEWEGIVNKEINQLLNLVDSVKEFAEENHIQK